MTPVLASDHWMPIKSRIDFKILLLAYKVISGQSYLEELIGPYNPKRLLCSHDAGSLVSRIFKSRAFSYPDPLQTS